MALRIILADDHKIVRDGIRALIETQEGFEVVAEAMDGRIAVSLAEQLSPDVVIMDIGMPELNGIDAMCQIAKANPEIKVIALSMYSDRHFVTEMLKAGAKGYLLKDCAFDELVHAIRVVSSNQIYLSPGIAGMVVEDYLKNVSATERTVYAVLTEREREVLKLLAEGNNNRNIGRMLYISEKTVETHRRQIMHKLGVNSLVELIKCSIREGLVVL